MPRTVWAKRRTQRGRAARRGRANGIRLKPSRGWVSTFFECTALVCQRLQSVSWIASSRPPLPRRRDIGCHAVSLEVTEEKGSRVRGSTVQEFEDSDLNSRPP